MHAIFAKPLRHIARLPALLSLALLLPSAWAGLAVAPQANVERPAAASAAARQAAGQTAGNTPGQTATVRAASQRSENTGDTSGDTSGDRRIGHRRAGFPWAMLTAVASGAGLAWVLVRMGRNHRAPARETPAPGTGKLC